MDANRSSTPIPKGPWDVVVVGAGAAGLMSCLELPPGLRVLLLNRNAGRRSSSRWAQGGIAAVTRSDDSAGSHAEDTIRAGAGLCDGDAVRQLVDLAPNCVDRLLRLGMAFDRDGAELATTLEAAHSHHRVLHVQDRTGCALVEVLRDRVDARPNLVHRRGVRVTKLWVEDQRCCGVQVLDGNQLHWIRARAVVLASGGGGHLFTNTTNPAQACGEGIALAWQAGAAVKTRSSSSSIPPRSSWKGPPVPDLEAVRGEGACCWLARGKPRRPLRRDLAPRIRSAALGRRCAQGSEQMGDLAILAERAEQRFPTILDRCSEYGLNPWSGRCPSPRRPTTGWAG